MSGGWQALWVLIHLRDCVTGFNWEHIENISHGFPNDLYLCQQRALLQTNVFTVFCGSDTLKCITLMFEFIRRSSCNKFITSRNHLNIMASHFRGTKASLYIHSTQYINDQPRFYLHYVGPSWLKCNEIYQNFSSGLFTLNRGIVDIPSEWEVYNPTE